MPTYSPSLKQQIVQQLLNKSSTIDQLSKRYGISRNTLFRWKAQSVKAIAQNSPKLTARTLKNGQEFVSIKGNSEATPDCSLSLISLLQNAFKAQQSLWQGHKCEELAASLGINIEQLRDVYEQIHQDGGVVSSAQYRALEQQLLASQEQLSLATQRIKILEAKEQIYLFYLEAFRKQSVHYKLDFNTLNDQLKGDFLSLIASLQREGMNLKEAADLIGINIRTYYRWLKQVPESTIPNQSNNQQALHAAQERAAYKFIPHDELELLQELLILPEYQGMPIKQCYEKLKVDNLITMSQGSFYRFLNKHPSLKALLKK